MSNRSLGFILAPFAMASLLSHALAMQPPTFSIHAEGKRTTAPWVCEASCPSQLCPDATAWMLASTTGEMTVGGSCSDIEGVFELKGNVLHWEVIVDWGRCGPPGSCIIETGYPQGPPPIIRCDRPFFASFWIGSGAADDAFGTSTGVLESPPIPRLFWGLWCWSGACGLNGGSLAVTFTRSDFDASGSVDGTDLGTLMSCWGYSAPPELPFGRLDLDSDGRIGGGDLGILLANWGPCDWPQ
jgi:hypothetical protein